MLDADLAIVPTDAFDLVGSDEVVESLTADHETVEGEGISHIAFAPYCCCIKEC
jgi:hypothetical protein